MQSGDVQVLANVLEDTRADAHTRRRVLQVAAGGALALGAATPAWAAKGESTERILNSARFAQTALGGRQQIPINRSFAPWSIKTVAGMIRALEGAGIGFGERGSQPGAFYNFPGDPVANGVGLVNAGRKPV